MPLLGRETELKRLTELVEGAKDRGGGLLIRGEAGIGKSALLDEAAGSAAVSGLRVLTAAGSESERNLPYSGLHQLLFPIRSGVDALPGPQRAAVRAALGHTDATVPSMYLVGMATLTMLSEEAARTPLLLAVEDVHWMDPPSAEVLTFVARRLGSEPVVLVATSRDGVRTPLEDAGLPPLTPARLSEDLSRALVDSVAPDLDPVLRARLLDEAAGNPLALTELPTAARPSDGAEPVLALTDRLERAFAARFADLPARTRTCLLAAALNDGSSSAEALAAATLLSGTPADVSVLAPGADAGLVELGPGTVGFRHPLMRSAIVSVSGPQERQDTHRALAEVLDQHRDRRAWHRASATAGTDEQVAAELELTADRALRRGGAAAAISALERSALLSSEPERRGGRLLRAAELAVESGRRDLTTRLLREAQTLVPNARQRATAAWLLSGFDDGLQEDTARTSELADLAGAVASDGDTDLAMRILWGAAMRCFWAEPGPAARRSLVAVADRLEIPGSDARMIAVSAYVAPVERGQEALDGLRELAGTSGRDPQVDRFLGSASLQVGAFDLSARFSAAALPGLSSQGLLGLLARALGVQAWSSARLGNLATALPAAAEAERLARETDQPYILGLAMAVQAEVAALRGDQHTAQKLADQAERVGLAAGARPVLATVQLARGLSALAEGRHDDAFAHLRRMLDPNDPAHQIALRSCAVAELSEAAVRSGQVSAMGEIMRELEGLAPSSPSPALHIGLRHARAVLAPREEAEERFREAVGADLTGWPLERGRTQLAFGEWLRRQRRVVESRIHLREARETFDALGVVPWGDRARAELRTAGESSPRRGPDARDTLTAHELGIAALAAEGLTNREIGQRLYLSHRTVSTHLHRIFPKLGVSSRSELGAALRAAGHG